MLLEGVSILRKWRSQPLARNGRVMAVLVAAISVSCAKRVPEPPNLAPGTPYISWIIMHGDADNPDQQFACQSDPLTECVVPPSRPDAQGVFGHSRLLSRCWGRDRIEGSFRVGFLQGSSASYEVQVNNTVKENEKIYNQSIHGLVTSTPGTYKLAFNVTPTVNQGGRRQTIRQEVSVAVK